ncbi:MAG TPA: glycoside hydrolase family 36 protein [Thermoanaerobaculia bacterium]|nr:glycoside hydrolase family 36 protein [Thermoanaerobaculia bacterium]
MKVRPRTFTRRLVLAAIAATSAVLGAGASRAMKIPGRGAEKLTWFVGNSLVSARLTFAPDGRVVTTGLRDLSRSLEWGSPEGGLGFRIALRAPSPDAPPDADPAAFDPVTLTEGSTWDLARVTAQTGPDGTMSFNLVLASREAPVSVTWSLVCYPESPVVRSSVAVTNTGARRVLLETVDSLDAGLTAAGGTLSSLTVNNFNWGHPATGFQTTHGELGPGTSVLARTGMDGAQAAWLALRSAQWNAGIFAGWEWSGPGLLAAAGSADGTAQMGVGFAPGTFAHVLAAGETFTSPTAFMGVFSGDFDAAGAATRDFVARRIAPPLPAPDFPWAGFDTWGYGFGIDEALVETLIDRAAALGVETFTLDAGWFPRVGDWTADPQRFPGGLATLAARAHAHGMRFGLWIALGAADPASQVVQDHPEWVAHVGGKPVVGDMGSVALCLADPDVRAWILEQVDRLVAAGSLDWIVHDFTVITACDDPGHSHQAGDGAWASTAGYYAVLDEIRRRHPKLVLENCWDGGSLFDFGMVARHDTSATSDRNDASGNQLAVYGGTYLVPPRYLDKYVGDDGTPDAYRFLSAVPGGPMLLMGAPTNWSLETQAAATAAVALFKQNRVVNRDGAVYHLTAQPGTGATSAIESYEPDSGAGVLTAWNPPGPAASTATVNVQPVGLTSDALYDVSVTMNLSAERIALTLPADTGANLMSAGIPIPLAPADGAALVVLTKR